MIHRPEQGSFEERAYLRAAEIIGNDFMHWGRALDTATDMLEAATATHASIAYGAGASRVLSSLGTGASTASARPSWYASGLFSNLNAGIKFYARWRLSIAGTAGAGMLQYAGLRDLSTSYGISIGRIGTTYNGSASEFCAICHSVSTPSNVVALGAAITSGVTDFEVWGDGVSVYAKVVGDGSTASFAAPNTPTPAPTVVQQDVPGTLTGSITTYRAFCAWEKA